MREIAATRCPTRSFDIEIVVASMRGNRLHDLAPLSSSVNRIDLPECFIHIGDRRNHGRTGMHRSEQRLPAERISPRIVFPAFASRLLQYLEKMDSPFVVVLVIKNLSQKGEPHSIVRIRDRKALCLPEQFPC